MGVPKFYRFISERYPVINAKIEDGVVPAIDNLYLDMNGIVHNCVRGNGAKDAEDGERYQTQLHVHRTQEDMLLDVFKYIDNLFAMIRPQKLIYFAIDGVAPRAKMNQQRSRRFRSAKERSDEHKRRAAEDPMYVAADKTPFDSNCISPGTEFMQRLTEALRYYVNERISNNPYWSNIEVVLSGAEAHGEGEHKIMEYIRAVKAAGKMPPNTRHCLYGLDADLIMLALVSHEPHFFLLREKVDFGSYWRKKGGPRIATKLDKETFGEFELLSIGLLRECLALDIGAFGNSSLPYFDIERIIDDFVFILMLVGNDFLPHLPTIEIADGMVMAMIHLYKRLLPRYEGYLTESGRIVSDRFELFVAKLALLEPRAMQLKAREHGRGRREGGGRGLKSLFSNSEDLDSLWGFSETPSPVSIQNGYNMEGELQKCRAVTHSVSHVARKRKYYKEKLGEQFDLQPELSLEELTSRYIEGVVWTLRYYFEGCRAWRWYYPYHYAPFPSDLIDVAAKANPKALNLPTTKPFLPLEQLLSVLPPSSSWCLPAPYQSLMTSALSPVRDFYPEDFETDMNGKKNDWEAVVLLPFVDADRLFKAMVVISNSQLTPNERSRNTRGHSFVYRRSSKPSNIAIESPFPSRLRSFSSSAERRQLKLPSIPSGTPFPASWVKGTKSAGSEPALSDLPTLITVPHSSRLDRVGVNLFGYPSKSESLVISLSTEGESRDFIFFDGVGGFDDDSPMEDSSSSTEHSGDTMEKPDERESGAENGPPETVDKAQKAGIKVNASVWTGYPWRIIGVVHSVIDVKKAVGLKEGESSGTPQVLPVSQNHARNFVTSASEIAANLMISRAIDIDRPKVVVDVRRANPSSIVVKKSKAETAYQKTAAVMVVPQSKQDQLENRTALQREVLAGDLRVNDVALFDGRGPYFGHVCQIKSKSRGEFFTVQYEIPRDSAKEPAFAYGIVDRWQSQRWKSLRDLAIALSLSKDVANKFLGSVRVKPSPSAKDEVDLGLGIKYKSRGLHVPGYAKIGDNGSYFFSDKTLALLKSYKESFPEVFAGLERTRAQDRASRKEPVYGPQQLFGPVRNGEEVVNAVASWISCSEVASLPLVPSGSSVLPRDAIAELERKAVVARDLQADYSKYILKGADKPEPVTVSSSLLRTGREPLDWRNEKGDSHNIAPVSENGMELRLGDRVANRIAYNGTPFGLRGTVIGIHHDSPVKMDSSLPESSSSSDENVPASSCSVEVVFDESFIGGGDLNGLCSFGHGKAVPAASLYIIRPDRDNLYYNRHFARVLRIAQANGLNDVNQSVADAQRRAKAVAAAAVSTYRKALSSIKDSTDQAYASVTTSREITEPKIALPNPSSLPMPSFVTSRRRTNCQPHDGMKPGSSRANWLAAPVQQSTIEIGNEPDVLTAKLKALLGITPAVSTVEEVECNDKTGVGAFVQRSISDDESSARESSSVATTTTARDISSPEADTISSSEVEGSSSESEASQVRLPPSLDDPHTRFANIWDQLRNRSGDR